VDVETGMPDRDAADPDVGDAGEDELHHLFGRGGTQMRPYQPVAGDFRDGEREKSGREGWNRGDCEHGGVALPDRLGAVAQILQPDQVALDLDVKQRAALGRRHPAAVAVEELETKIDLQLLDLPGYRRLGALEQVCRAGNGAGGHDGREGFELAGIEGALHANCGL
jgi:hypothetical protein